MAIIEGFRVRNFRALRDVTLGKSSGQGGEPLTPFTVVIGKNGVGKSSLFDAFGFVADCLAMDVETSCSSWSGSTRTGSGTFWIVSPARSPALLGSTRR
ncbi:AAA family ATPase [Castellaniella defragrans]|uniref:AAA family ATPase n=1 Tax=Castellaniella defragrans TaxID=75697 RepID=UPI001F55C498|nr:AAA family ATPase [Castellaniella defragrans]